MPPPPYAGEQRLAFGRVAELYELARPSYPAAAVDAVVAHAGAGAVDGGPRSAARVLEVGAGTGKATVAFAQRGLSVLALEPSAEMAAVARRRCPDLPAVQIVECEFERWRPQERFDLLVSAAAWHWIDPALRYHLARDALAPGATLAALWTLPDWRACALRGELSDAYRTAAPGLTADFPMHPDSIPTRLAGDWHGEIAAAGAFGEPEVRTFPWTQRYSTQQYCLMLGTHQDHILLGDAGRERLLRGVAGVIDSAGGKIAMPWVTYVCLARRLHGL